jgi:SAM-dependent methyltransferase
LNECYSGVENLEVMQEARNYNRYLLNLVISEGHGVAAALDFGAGIGTFASELRKNGTRVICIEPDLALRRRLQGEQFEAHESLDLIPAKSVPYIYSLNVLEHIDDDLGALRELYRRLTPGGTLLIYVPAFEILYSSADKRIGHKRRYTRGVLVRRLKTAGFEVDEARYADSLGFGVALLFKFIGNKEGRVSPLAVKVFDKWIFPLSTTLDHVMSRVAGKNILVIAHRPHDAVSEKVEAQCSPVG